MSPLKGVGERKRCSFITAEGIDGCGKTTISKFICEWLRSKGFDVVFTVEPTTTWIGDSVKRGFSEGVHAFTEALLFMADRAQHTLQIKEWVSEGKVVVSDRYIDSTLAYQGASLQSEGMEDAVEWLKNASAPYVLVPDITFLLQVNPEVAMQRISNRSKMTKFEKLNFLVEVDRVYRSLSESKERFRIVDASQILEDVKGDVVKMLESEF
ncbi:MAG: dTMP kinase [Thermoplasmata archaeon]|nr:dTMP kinase [Thermoplasmata archaeon]